MKPASTAAALEMPCGRSGRMITRVLLALCFIAFALRVWRLDFHPIWFDEDLAYQRATAALDASLASTAGSPLYYIILRGWVELTGSSLYALRFFSAVCGVLTLPLIYQITYRLLDRNLGLAAMALATFAPFYVYYSQEARTYSFTLVLMLVSLSTCLHWLDTRRRRSLIACTLANLVCLYTHYVAALVIVTQGAIVLLTRWRDWKRIGIFVAAQTVAVVALVPWLFYVQGALPRVIAPPDSTTMDAWSILARTWTEFSVGRTIAPPESLFLATMPLFLALAGLLSLFVRTTRARPAARSESSRVKVNHVDDRSARAIILMWLIVPLVGSMLIPRASVRFSPKYLIAITPVYYMLMMLGLRALRRESRVLFGLGLAVLISLWLYVLGDYYLRQHEKLAQRPWELVVTQEERRPDEVTLQLRPPV